jgi:serine/threonine-protein kinase
MQTLAPDTIVDERYRILKRIGSGGMADVYCAEDQQLGRQVALKVLYRRFAEDEEFVERFRREASAAAGLQHPNVVQVFDRGEWDETYYIAMEFLPGRSLKQVIREEGPLDPDYAIDIAVQVLKAARFAHKRGIVHRDMKPHNVIVDDEGRVKVTDFGIARAGASEMTETGAIIGTAQYLSPEQAQGHAVSARSDLYSIGVVLYEMLTGRVPFEADSAVTIALKHVSAEPAAPSRLNPEVSPELEDVVMQALAKDPGARFADADEFVEALEDARLAPPGTGATRVLPTTGAYPALAATDGGYPMPPDPYSPEDMEERDRRFWLWALLILLLAGLAVGAFLLLTPQTKPVPNVVGKPSDVAARILQDAGFEVNVENVTSPTVKRDIVATQEPQPDVEAKEGSTVTIIVSTGPGQANIPFVEGLPRDEAEQRLRAAGFKVRVRREFSDTVERGIATRTSPPPRTLHEKGQTVDLYVSRGPEEVEVPDVVGRDRDEAERILQDRDLRVTVEEEESSDEEPGTVLRQDPEPNTRVEPESEVEIVVAIEPTTVPVPEVEGLESNDAIDELQASGFRVRQRFEDVTTPEEDGFVIRQDPAPGENRKKGSRVTIVVGRFTPPNLDPDPGATATPTPGAEG